MTVIFIFFDIVHFKFVINGSKVVWLWLSWGGSDTFDQPGRLNEWQQSVRWVMYILNAPLVTNLIN